MDTINQILTSHDSDSFWWRRWSDFLLDSVLERSHLVLVLFLNLLSDLSLANLLG